MYPVCTCYTTGALSVTDDDYGISYIVTMVDVRSCTRPPRSPYLASSQGRCVAEQSYVHKYLRILVSSSHSYILSVFLVH